MIPQGPQKLWRAKGCSKVCSPVTVKCGASFARDCSDLRDRGYALQSMCSTEVLASCEHIFFDGRSVKAQICESLQRNQATGKA